VVQKILYLIEGQFWR